MKKIVLSMAIVGSLAMGQAEYNVIPYGGVAKYSGNSDKDYASSIGLYISGSEKPYKTIVNIEGKKITYDNPTNNKDDISQTDIGAIFKYEAIDNLHLKIGVHHIISTDDLTDGGNILIGGISFEAPNFAIVGLDLYSTKYKDFTTFDINQFSPKVGFNFENNSVELRGDFINISNNEKLNLNSSYSSAELTIKNKTGIWTTTLSGWGGKRIFAVYNDGLSVNNIPEEERGGVSISEKIDLNNFSSLKFGYSYTKLKGTSNSGKNGNKNGVNIAYVYKFMD
jgi:hypothetical protein